MRPPIQMVTIILRALTRPILVGFFAFSLSTGILANPVLDNVAAGQVTIEQAPNTTTINQSSQKGIINWQSFNNGAIINQGQIIAAEHGLVALIGGAVTNNGMIQANMGHIVLASGEAFTMS